MNKFCILDTFVALPLVNYWNGYNNAITVLEAGTFELKAGNNSIYMWGNGLLTVQPGTFVLPGTGDIINKTYIILKKTTWNPDMNNLCNRQEQNSY